MGLLNLGVLRNLLLSEKQSVSFTKGLPSLVEGSRGERGRRGNVRDERRGRDWVNEGGGLCRGLGRRCSGLVPSSYSPVD